MNVKYFNNRSSSFISLFKITSLPWNYLDSHDKVLGIWPLRSEQLTSEIFCAKRYHWTVIRVKNIRLTSTWFWGSLGPNYTNSSECRISHSVRIWSLNDLAHASRSKSRYENIFSSKLNNFCVKHFPLTPVVFEKFNWFTSYRDSSEPTIFNITNYFIKSAYTLWWNVVILITKTQLAILQTLMLFWEICLKFSRFFYIIIFIIVDYTLLLHVCNYMQALYNSFL